MWWRWPYQCRSLRPGIEGPATPQCFPPPPPCCQGCRKGRWPLSLPQPLLRTRVRKETRAGATASGSSTPHRPSLARPATRSTAPSGWAPSLQGISERAGTRVAGLGAEEYIRQSILETNAYIVEGFPESLMPVNFSETLSAEELDAVIAFLMTQ